MIEDGDLFRYTSDPGIVLSSTWRNGIARDGSTAVHIEDLIRALKPVYSKTLDKAAVSPDESRSKEIDYYLRRHPKESYLILDDNPSLFAEGRKTPHLHLTDSQTGFTDRDVKKIIKRYL